MKVTLPSPLVLYSMWSPELSTAVYKDAYEMFADAAAIIRAEAEALAQVPGVTFGLHLCKGNYLSQWIGEGGYDLTAQALFNRLTNFDVLLLEYE